ncbi:hypothetical protein EB241_01130 [Erwinia psidii]|uniref:Uncharacterized protein n=1 Tax=Erwinia psidii TaxID=69224 RepID=A0A3N6SQ31_9GAMM|nr:hypothetical protein EB241_01130 [Erwinia psidii]
MYQMYGFPRAPSLVSTKGIMVAGAATSALESNVAVIKISGITTLLPSYPFDMYGNNTRVAVIKKLIK